MQQSTSIIFMPKDIWRHFLYQCRWMGLGSLPFIILAAVFVASALVIDCVIELQKYGAQDLSGAFIALGLLRELGPLVVGLGWVAHVAAIICNQALMRRTNDDKNFVFAFLLPGCLAAVTMSIPLAIYGLTIGFITGALTAPLVGRTSTTDFFEAAHNAIRYKDVFIYFTKLSLINPLIGVLAGSYCGKNPNADPIFASGQAVSATFIFGFFANLIVTYCSYHL